MDSKGEWMPLQDCVDTKTPAQVAEDCEREALIELKECRCPCPLIGNPEHRPTCPSASRLTRALAAKAWATAERMLEVGRSVRHGMNQSQVNERDRLRREYEALVEKGEGRSR